MKISVVCSVLLCVTWFSNALPAQGSGSEEPGNWSRRLEGKLPPVAFKKRANPTPGTAPLDINATLQNELNSLNQILGVVGGGVSGLVAGLTGISITNCAGQIKAKGDVNSMTCEEFLDALSGCESLMNVKDLIQAAKKQYKKNPNSKKRCFK